MKRAQIGRRMLLRINDQRGFWAAVKKLAHNGIIDVCDNWAV